MGPFTLLLLAAALPPTSSDGGGAPRNIAGSGCFCGAKPCAGVDTAAWTFFPDGCGWAGTTNWSLSAGPSPSWSQPGTMATANAGYKAQPAVDFSVAFAKAPLRPPLTANFTWTWAHMWSSVGFVFRAHGTADYYEVSFPAVGQAQRSEMTWLLVSKINTAQGWREGIHWSLLPGVASEPKLPHRTRVELGVAEVTVTVDERARVTVPLPADAGPYRVGVSSYILADIEGTPSTLADLSVASRSPLPTAAAVDFAFNWTTAKRASAEVSTGAVGGVAGTHNIPKSAGGTGQLVRATRPRAASSSSPPERLGDLFMINAQQLLHASNGGLPLAPCTIKYGVSSCGVWNATDLPKFVSMGILGSATIPEGEGAEAAQLSVFAMDMRPPGAPMPDADSNTTELLPCTSGCVNSSGWVRLIRSRSGDGGRTWQTDPKPAWLFHFNDSAVAVLHSQVLQLRSGKLMCIFQVNTLARESGFTGAGGSFLLQPPPGGKMFSLTSSDGGQSWASLANLDGPPYIRTPPTGVDVSPVLWIAEARGNFGSEIAATETADGKIIAMVRPHCKMVILSRFVPLSVSLTPKVSLLQTPRTWWRPRAILKGLSGRPSPKDTFRCMRSARRL